jgi:non-lysosomal glucosylceramidase
MRSAVPLGGISCGAVELRADGSLHEWTIMNGSPGGSAKIQSYPDAYFAAKVNSDAPIALQTHPLTPGLKGVSSLTYFGSYPVSKLSPSTADLSGVQADLFAFSTYKVNDMNASARPMASFTLAVSAASAAPSNANNDISFMMNLPTAIEPDMVRRGSALGAAVGAESSAACLSACNANSACMSWNFARATKMCTLQRDAPNVFYSLGNDCGLRGSWEYDKTSQCLTLTRAGSGGSNGDMSICASTSGGQSSNVSFGTYDTGSGAFVDLAKPSLLNGAVTGANGAIAVSAQVAASSNATLTISFGWNFPLRDHFGKVLGNYYKNLFATSSRAAFGNVVPEDRSKALAGVVGDILDMQSPFHGSSLEPWLQDHLVNSLSHIRTAMWFDQCPHCHKTSDTRSDQGYWRQWEAFDCPDLDSIHNDGERHIPYIMFWPSTTRNKLAAWAGNQGENGMLAEQIHNSDPDQPEGRVMADSTSMFICYILELLRWSGDTQTLKLYYPTVKRAAEWQMNVSATFGVPLKLQTTYDILGFTKYELSSYSSIFHLMAMRAAAELAKASGETADATKFSAAADRGRASLDELQWASEASSTSMPNTYCPENYDYVGAGMTAKQCLAKCIGSCDSVFLSTNSRGDCYLCRNADVLSNSSGYTLYTKSGAVAGSWAAASDNCTEAGCTTQHGFFGDTLYAQVLAYTVGLGTIVSSEEKLKSHLRAELATNCVHAEGETLAAGCDNAGIVILTGRKKTGVTDWQIWEGGPPNHATVAIRSGESPSTALDNFHHSATSWSERINDQWNTAGELTKTNVTCRPH